MKATSYAEPVNDDEREQVRAAHAAVLEAETALAAALEHRDELLYRLYGQHRANVRDLVEVTDLHRTVVHRIVRGARPAPTRGPRA